MPQPDRIRIVVCGLGPPARVALAGRTAPAAYVRRPRPLCECSKTPDPERFIDTDTPTLSALGVVHFAVIGKEHRAIGTFRRTRSRQLPDTGQSSGGGPGMPAALTGRTGSRS
jgi:hypothetical protein